MAKIISLSGVVGWDITARYLKSQLVTNDINILKVDSEGGSVFEANRLFNVITDFLKDYPDSIKVELGSLAASAASYFPLAVGKENVSVRENTTFMIHKAWFFTWGNSDELLRDAEILDGLDRIIAKIYMSYTGSTIDETLEAMKNELWVIGGEAILEAGFASKVIESSSEGENKISDEITPKTEILAKIEEAKNKLKDSEIEEDLNKWAARLKINTEDPGNSINSIEDIENSESIPEAGINNYSEEQYMDLNEFFEKNPAAKAENEASIAAAKAEGKEEVLNEERKRVADIVALTSIKLPENVLNSINEGDSVADFALNEVEAAKKTGPEKPDDELGGLEAGNQLPKGSVKKAEEIGAETDKAVNDYINSKNRRK